MAHSFKLATRDAGISALPAVQPLLVCALAVWAMCAGVYGVLYIHDSLWIYTLLGALAGFVFAIGRWRVLVTHRFGKYLIVGALAGCVLASCGAGSMWAQKNMLQEALGQGKQVTVIALEDSSNTDYGSSFDALILDQGIIPCRVRVYASNEQQLYFGQMATVGATYQWPQEAKLSSYWTKGLAGSLSVKTMKNVSYATCFAQVRGSFVNSVLREYAIDNAQDGNAVTGLLLALACGYRETLSGTELYRNFQTAGVAHIVAISGAHLSLIVALLGSLLNMFGIRREMRATVQIAFIGMFLIISAIPISAFRAAVMAGTALLSFGPKRRYAAQNALSICIMLFIGLDVSASLSVSLALSALSTLSIVLFGTELSRRLHGRFSALPKALSDALALTFAASIATLPLSGALFSQVSLIAPVTNCLMVPLFAPVCCACVICAFLSFVGVGGALVMAVPNLLCAVMAWVVQFAAALPYAALPCSVSIVAALILSVCLSIATYAYLLGAISSTVFVIMGGVACAALAARLLLVMLSGPTLTMLDVGQGDAILLQDGTFACLVDTGNNDSALRSQLAQCGVTHLDGLIITHADDDHCGSCDVLLSLMRVDTVYVSSCMFTCSCSNCKNLITQLKQNNAHIVGVEQGDAIKTKSFSCTVLWPESYADDGGNNDSLCLDVWVLNASNQQQIARALLVGDVESEALERMCTERLLNDVDIFKVGHHGSKNSCSEQVLNVIQPEIALISVGAGNRYGHPSEVARTLLAEKGARIFRTDESGRIACTFEKDGIHVRELG